MSARSDRSIGGRWPFIGLAFVLFLAALGAGALWWSRSAPVDGPAGEQPQQTAADARPDAPLPVALFVPAGDALVQAAGSIRRQPELQLEARAALSALLADQRAAQAPVLREVRLRALYVDAAGTAFVDLAGGPSREVRGAVRDELLAVYAVVNTLMQNFQDVKQVRFLLDGRESSTLAGHLDLSRAFVTRADLVKAP